MLVKIRDNLLKKLFLKFNVLFCFKGLKCPVCSRFILPDDIECHLVMCLTKPRLTYNGNTFCYRLYY